MKRNLEIEELISATLRGDGQPWPANADDEFAASFLVRSEYHGVQALLDQRLQTAHGFELGWPKAVVHACRRAAMIQAMWEIRHQGLLNQVLAQLSSVGVSPILFKGSAMAYDLYASPFLRSRGDTDLIIPYHTRDQVGEVLESLGFSFELGARGDLVSYQALYSRADSITHPHALDLHWRINDSQVLSKLFSYEELSSEARSLPALGPEARAAGLVHALLLACMHRMGHKQCAYITNDIEYYGGDRLIWLFDIHLLLGELRPSQYDTFLELTERKGLGGVCLEGIEHASAHFESLVPEKVREELCRLKNRGVATRYLNASVAHQYYLNFFAIEGATNKVCFLTQLFVPSQKYMRNMYSQVKPNWLPWLYLRRAAIEIFKRIYRTLAAKRPVDVQEK